VISLFKVSFSAFSAAAGSTGGAGGVGGVTGGAGGVTGGVAGGVAGGGVAGGVAGGVTGGVAGGVTGGAGGVAGGVTGSVVTGSLITHSFHRVGSFGHHAPLYIYCFVAKLTLQTRLRVPFFAVRAVSHLDTPDLFRYPFDMAQCVTNPDRLVGLV
jgi:hypothetical protein